MLALVSVLACGALHCVGNGELFSGISSQILGYLHGENKWVGNRECKAG